MSNPDIPGEPLPQPGAADGWQWNGSHYRQTVQTAAGILFLQGAAFLTSVLIARGLGAEAFGRFQLVLSVSIFLTMLATVGLDESLAYLLPKYQARAPRKVFCLIAYALGVAGAASLAIALLFWWRADMFEGLFGLDGVAWDLRFMLLLLPALVCMTMTMAVLRGLGRSDWRAYLYYYTVGSLFLLGVAVLMIGGLSPAEAYWARIGSVAVGAVVALLLIARLVPAAGTWLDRGDVLAVHSFSGWMVFLGLFHYLIEQPLIDLLLVGRFDSSAAVGLYSVAAKAGAVAALGGTALTVVMAPVFARAAVRGDAGELRKRYLEASKWMALAAVISGTFILLFHQQLLSLFGAEYQQASTILQIYVAGQIVAGLLGVNTPLLVASGRAWVEFCLSAAACLFLVCAGVLLGDRFGATGVAAASAASIALLAVARRIVVARLLRSSR